MFNISITALILGAVFLSGYYVADLRAQNEFNEFKLQAEKQYTELLEKSSLWERNYQGKLQEIELDRLFSLVEQKQEYEKIIANLRADNLSGVHKCGSASENSEQVPANSTGELVCYTERDLLTRVEGTMAIGARCDKLATDYNTLLKIIEAYNHE